MVRRILKHEVYYGSITWGKRPVIRKLINGEVNKIRVSSDNYMLVRGMQEAIVSKEKWDIAATRIGPSARKKKETPQTTRGPCYY